MYMERQERYRSEHCQHNVGRRVKGIEACQDFIGTCDDLINPTESFVFWAKFRKSETNRTKYSYRFRNVRTGQENKTD